VIPKKVKKTVFLAAVMAALLAMYSVFIEPYWLQVSYHQLTSDLEIPLKIAHLTDLHLKRVGAYERKILNILAIEKPDLIVVTGDTVDDQGSLLAAKDFFQQVSAPLGIWMVNGNWENWQPIPDAKDYYSSFSVHLLMNESVVLKNGLILKGFDDDISGTPDYRNLASNEKKHCIALFHSPIVFDAISKKCALAFSGHTHGGQIRIPFIGPIWLPEGSGKYVSGWYEENGARMYVSRGLGTSLLPIRFLSRPEIAFITLGAR
jgi:uncharacterized protein